MATQLQLGFADYYDRHADEYLKKKRDRQLFFNDAIEVPATIEILNCRAKALQEMTVLDVGSGLGTYSYRLGELGAHVTAIDVSRRMTEITERRCEGLNVTCLNVDFFDFAPTHGGEFRFVVGGFMLGYFDNLEATFERLRRLTAKGGTVIVSSIHPAKTSSRMGATASVPYFGRTEYETDFLSDTEPLKLRRWLIEEVTGAAYGAKFAVDYVLEPRPRVAGFGSPDMYEYYAQHPSVVVYVLRRR